jgi:hypothetical protein
MFLDGVTELKQLKTQLEKQRQLITQQRDSFKTVLFKMKKNASLTTKDT